MINLEKYTFKAGDGCLLSSQPFANGNMIYATAQLIFLNKDKDLDLCLYYRGLCASEKGHIGTYSRYVGTTTDTSVDDYMAVCCLPEFARGSLNASNFGFLSVNPGFTGAQFLYRFQGFWNHMKITSGKTILPIGRLAWALSVFFAARKPFSSQDSWIQTHLMVITAERYKHNSFIGRLAVEYFWYKKGSMTTSKIMADYCQILDHPLVQVWEGYN